MNNLKLLRTRANMKQTELAQKLGIAQSTLSGWETGKFEIDNANLNKLASLFGVTIDYILGREDPLMAAAYDTVLIQEFKSLPKEKREAALAYVSDSQLTARDKRDIARDMEQLTESIETSDALMFDGEPLSPEAKESLLAAMRLGLEAAKLKNKERFTPNKYRKD